MFVDALTAILAGSHVLENVLHGAAVSDVAVHTVSSRTPIEMVSINLINDI